MKIFNLKKPALITSIILLLLGIPTGLSIGYYSLLRWVVCSTAGLIAYVAYQMEKPNWTYFLGIIAIVFNPILPIYLSKSTWVFIDLAVIATFFIAFFKLKEKRERNNLSTKVKKLLACSQFTEKLKEIIIGIIILGYLFYLFKGFFSNPCSDLPENLTREEWENRCDTIHEVRDAEYQNSIRNY